MSRKAIYIEASVLTRQHQSGIAKTVEYLVRALSATPDRDRISLVVPFDKKKKLDSLSLGLPIKTVPIHSTLLRILKKFNIVPPLDIFIRKGIFVFTDYWNTPLITSHGITCIYDLSFLLHPEFTEEKNRAFLTKHIRRWCLRADVILTISKQVKEELKKHLDIPESKIEVSYLGVDYSKYFRRQDDEVIDVLRKYDIMQTGYFLSVGNVEPRKNLQAAIRAHDLLPDEVAIKHPLIIVGGDGWNNSEINALIKDDTRTHNRVIRIHQYVEDNDLPCFYSGAVALIQISSYEGFGLTPLEALACNTKVLVGDIPVSHEVLKTGKGVYFADPNDAHVIHQQLKRLISNSNEVRVEMPDEYTWKRTAKRFLDICDKLSDNS